MPDGSLLLPGTFPVHDLSHIGIDPASVPKVDYTTIAGLVVAALGRIPTSPGDRVKLPECTIEVSSVGGRPSSVCDSFNEPPTDAVGSSVIVAVVGGVGLDGGCGVATEPQKLLVEKCGQAVHGG